jgi:hypothetical protein
MVWFIWSLSIVSFFVLTFFGIRKLRKVPFSDFGNIENIRNHLWCFFKEEGGVAYSLSFAMVFPIYVLIVALILEATFMLIAKTGTLYAAFAAARSAIVWTTVEKPSDRYSEITGKSKNMAQQAAVQAMVPFASGLHQGNSSNNQAATNYLKAYQAYSEGKSNIRDEYVVNKYVYANRAVQTSLKSVGNGEIWKKDVEAVISYDAPFLLPYIGKLFGGKIKTINGVKVTVLTIQSQVSLLTECPMNDKGSLGISYATAK